MDAWCSRGSSVEVVLTEDGLSGSRYAGHVIEMADSRALIEFEASPTPSPSPLLVMICKSRSFERLRRHVHRRRSRLKLSRKFCFVSGIRRVIFNHFHHQHLMGSSRCATASAACMLHMCMLRWYMRIVLSRVWRSV